MPEIRPISDLRNNFTELSRAVHASPEPVFLTKNGYGDMVVMSMEAYEQLRFESEVFMKLKEAEAEAKSTDKRYTHEEVFGNLRQKLQAMTEDSDV